MPQQQKNLPKNKVRFIRVRGRVVPIPADKYRQQPGERANKAYNKMESSLRSGGTELRRTKRTVTKGAFFGSILGGVVGAAMGKGKLGAIIGGVGLAFLGKQRVLTKKGKKAIRKYERTYKTIRKESGLSKSSMQDAMSDMQAQRRARGTSVN